MTLTGLFRTTVLLAATLLGVSAVILIFLRDKLLWKRWFTWLVIAASFAVAYHLGESDFHFFYSLIVFGCIFEFLRLRGFKDKFIWLTWLGNVILVICWNQVHPLPIPAEIALLQSVACLVWARKKKNLLKDFTINFIAIFIISFGMSKIISIEDEVVALVLVVACFDVASYIGGKTLSKIPALSKKIFPKTSPNKTYIGVASGALGGAAILLLLQNFTWLGFIVLVIGAVLGDYLESKLKRMAGVKDAADWVPGFGGLLDRFDSYLMLIPFVLIIF